MFANFSIWVGVILFNQGRVKFTGFCNNAILMKLFKTTNNDIINECRLYFEFRSPSEL